MEGSEIKKVLLEGLMKQDGLSPAISKWLLKLEEVLTNRGEEIEELTRRVKELELRIIPAE